EGGGGAAGEGEGGGWGGHLGKRLRHARGRRAARAAARRRGHPRHLRAAARGSREDPPAARPLRGGGPGGRGVTVSTVRACGALRDVPRDAWNALVGHGSPFLEWDWLSALEESGAVCPDTGWLPQHLTVWEDDRLIGACPLYVKSHSQGEFVFDHHWASAASRARIRYYPKLLVAVPFTPVMGQRFL